MVVICKMFAEGHCKNGDRCAEAHIKVCKFFTQGYCKHGEKCRDKHLNTCKFFVEGHCKHGARCRDLHLEAVSAIAGGMGSKGDVAVTGGKGVGHHADVASGGAARGSSSLHPAVCISTCTGGSKARCRFPGCDKKSWDGKQGHFCSWNHETTHEPMEVWPCGSSMLSRVKVLPFDLLGSRLSSDKRLVDYGTAPDSSMVIVDPAKLSCMQSGPRGAGVASSFLYKCLGMSDHATFPQEVKKAVIQSGDAKYHAYGPDKDMHVLHAVGPDFTKGSWTAEDALRQLTQAYCNIFLEFFESELLHLRMLPVSFGSNAGKFARLMSQLTPLAIHEASAMIKPAVRNHLLQSDICLCVPIENHFEELKKSIWLAQAMAGSFAAAHVFSPVPPSSTRTTPGISATTPAVSGSPAVAPTTSKTETMIAGESSSAPESAWGSMLRTVKVTGPILIPTMTNPSHSTPFEAKEPAAASEDDEEEILDLF